VVRFGMAERRIVLVGYPGAELLDIAGPGDVFAAARRLAPGRAEYRVELAAARAGRVVTGSGLALVATRSIATLRGPIDTLVVAGGLLSAVEAARPMAPALARLARETRRTAAICTGAFLLAEAGLLRGRRVVTHWAACEALRQRHPDCRVEADRIFVHDRRVWTSAGVTAGLDLALALVEQDHGARLALDVARWLVMYLRRPGGQSQYSAPLAAQGAERDALSTLVAWVPENLRADLSVEALADRASMSARNFARVFRRETGTTPAVFVERLRLEAARRTLELTDRSVKEVADASGFGAVATMHRAFRRVLGTTPRQYRERFQVASGPGRSSRIISSSGRGS
jgi:transcriptional regulator GlxA family with amidase domain